MPSILGKRRRVAASRRKIGGPPAKRSTGPTWSGTISTKAVLSGKQKATLRYFDRFQLDAGTGGIPAVKVYSANGVYDPDITAVGHQPRGFDQLMALYDHFVVTSCTIKVYADNNAEASGVLVGVNLLDSLVTSTDFRNYMESATKKVLLLGASGGGGPCAKTVTYTCDPVKFLGRSDALSDPELKNSANSNPTEQAHWHVFAMPLNTGDAQPVNIGVELEYTGYFIEPKMPSVS
jgi:hypothetical protein